MNDDDFRDACAMLAMVGLLFNENYEAGCLADMSYHIADKMVAQRKAESEPEEGIVAIKKRIRRKP